MVLIELLNTMWKLLKRWLSINIMTEFEQPKDNNCMVSFYCPNREDDMCVYYSAGENYTCKYSRQNECMSVVAIVNRMTLEMKRFGIER